MAGAQKGKPPGFMKDVTLQNSILQKPGKNMFIAKMVAQLYQQKKQNSSTRGCHFFLAVSRQSCPKRWCGEQPNSAELRESF